MEDWQAALAVAGNLVAFSILAVVIIHDRLSKRSKRAKRAGAGGSSSTSATWHGAPGRAEPRASTRRRVRREESVSLPEHLEALARDRGAPRKQDGGRGGSGLSDTELAVIITEAGRRD